MKKRRTKRTKIKEEIKSENGRKDLQSVLKKIRKSEKKIKQFEETLDEKLNRTVRKTVAKQLEKPLSYKKLREFVEEEYGGVFNIVQAVLANRLSQVVKALTASYIQSTISKHFIVENKQIDLDVLKLKELNKEGWRSIYWGKLNEKDPKEYMFLERPKKIKPKDLKDIDMHELQEALAKALKNQKGHSSPKIKKRTPVKKSKIKRVPATVSRKPVIRKPVK